MIAPEYEYAISAGEGTLLDFGQCDFMELPDTVDELQPDQTLAISPAGENCETGL